MCTLSRQLQPRVGSICRSGLAQRLEYSDIEIVTASYFNVLNAKPTIGRFFASNEDRVPEGELVAVISFGLWRAEYGGSSSALGRTVVLRGRPFTIIGVAPMGFAGIDIEKTDAWIPFSVGAAYHSGSEWYSDERSAWYEVVARVGPNHPRPKLPSKARLSNAAGWHIVLG